MRRTGESYMAARRHFLATKDLQMPPRKAHEEHTLSSLSIDQLQLTLETTRILKTQGIHRLEQLLDAQAGGLESLGLAPQRTIEVRDVLACRGFRI